MTNVPPLAELIGKRITWGSGVVSYIVESIEGSRLKLLPSSAVQVATGLSTKVSTTTVDTASVGPVWESKIPCIVGLRVRRDRAYSAPHPHAATVGLYGRVKSVDTYFVHIEWEELQGLPRLIAIPLGHYHSQFVVAYDQDVLPEGINREMKPGKPAEQAEPLIATMTKTITNVLPGTYGALNIHEFNDNRFARLSIDSTPFNTAGLDHLISQLQFLKNVLESNRDAD